MGTCYHPRINQNDGWAGHKTYCCPKKKKRDECLLEVRNLARKPRVKVSLLKHKGEIVCFAGLVGSGRTETMRLIFGADERDAGHIIEWKELKLRSPVDAVEHGIGMLEGGSEGSGRPGPRVTCEAKHDTRQFDQFRKTGTN